VSELYAGLVMSDGDTDGRATSFSAVLTNTDDAGDQHVDGNVDVDDTGGSVDRCQFPFLFPALTGGDEDDAANTAMGSFVFSSDNVNVPNTPADSDTGVFRFVFGGTGDPDESAASDSGGGFHMMLADDADTSATSGTFGLRRLLCGGDDDQASTNVADTSATSDSGGFLQLLFANQSSTGDEDKSFHLF